MEENPKCGCGSDQTAKHLLMDCRITDDCRQMVLSGVTPDSVGWFLENEESYEKFITLVNFIFDMHEREDT